MSAKHICGASLLLAGLLAGGCGRNASVAPAPVVQSTPAPSGEDKFSQMIPYDPPYSTLKKIEIRGRTDSSALSEKNGTPIKDLEIYTYQLVTNDPAHVTNALEMIVSAPECLFNRAEASGSSAGPLTAQTADGRFLIQGVGYLWQSKGDNATLTISNKVFTTVKNDILSTNGGTTPVTAETGGRFIYIHSDSFHFDHNANLITYQDHVHAQDEQLDLTCDTINIRRATNGPISELVADGNIAVVDNITHGRTTGEHAVYSDENGAQLVTLTGNPYWQNGPEEATAQAFIFDRSGRTFRAQGGAHFKLPASAMSGSGFLLAPQTDANGPAPAAATNLVDVYAGAITMQLPATTNGPLQGVIAETNVVMVDPDHHSRATGDRAVYTEADGVLVLSGRAQWQSDEGTARAEFLTFDRTNLTFAALTNAYLKLPLAALTKSPAFGSLASQTSETTNRFLEVTSDSYDYRGDALTFRQNVHAGLLEGETPLGTLDSGTLTVGFRQTNVLQNIVADRNVHFRQPPTQTTNGKTVESDFTCDRVEVQMRTNGLLLESATTTGRTVATRTETPTNGGKPVHSSLAADKVNALFMPDTNAIQILVADHNVVMSHDEDTGTGDKVVYTATNDTAVLTGHPRLERPDATVTAEDAITYNRTTSEVRAHGYPRTAYKPAPGDLSESNLPAIPGPNPK